MKGLLVFALFFSFLNFSCSNSSSSNASSLVVDEDLSGELSLSTKNLDFSVKEAKNNAKVTFTPEIADFDTVYGDDGDSAPYVAYTWKIDGDLAQKAAGASVDSKTGVLTIDTSQFAKDAYQISCVAEILYKIEVLGEESTIKLAIFSWQGSLSVN